MLVLPPSRSPLERSLLKNIWSEGYLKLRNFFYTMPDVKDIFGSTYRENYSLDRIERQDGSRVESPFEVNLDGEINYARNCSLDYQIGYMDRLATLEASRKIVNETFDFKSVKNGAEFGCGMYGWFYNYFLPNGTGWKQFDISPKAVEYNREYTKKLFRKAPKIDVGNLYEMPLEDSSVDIIAGLSCWDSISYFEKAIKEVDRCLEPGGYFIHYQDLNIPDKVFVIAEAKKRIEKGLSSDVPVEVYAQTVPVGDIPGFFRTDYYFLSVDSVDFGLVRFGEYMTRHIANLFENAGFKIHISEERGGEVLVKKDKFNQLIKKHGIEHDGPENSFLSAYGKNILKHDPSVPKNYVKQQAFMDVLVAQKPK